MNSMTQWAKREIEIVCKHECNNKKIKRIDL